VSIKNDLKNILRELLRTAASDIFINKSLEIVEESAENNESLIAASNRISKRIGLFIDEQIAKQVFESLKVEIERRMEAPQKQRMSERVNVSAKVRVICNGASVELIMQTISLGGMYIRTDDPFPVGTMTEILLPMATGSPIHLRGVVIYIKHSLSNTSTYPPGMAVNFRDMTAGELKALKDYIESALGRGIAEPPNKVVL